MGLPVRRARRPERDLRSDLTNAFVDPGPPGATGAAPGGAWRRWWLASVGLALATLAVAAWDPVAHPGPVLCVFRRASGLPCPGCGLTRAVARLLRGDLAAAVSLHPLAPFLVAETFLVWAALGRRAWRGEAGAPRWLAPVALATAGVAIAVWLVRLVTGSAA